MVLKPLCPISVADYIKKMDERRAAFADEFGEDKQLGFPRRIDTAQKNTFED